MERWHPQRRVLHSVSTYLAVSENWIYPQICRVPGVWGRVLCRKRQGAEVFPLDAGDLIQDPSQGARFHPYRLFDALLRRGGASLSSIELLLRWWKPELIHAHFGPQGYDMIGLSRRLKVPLVCSFYGFDAWMLPQSKPEWLSKYPELWRSAAGFLVEGNAMKRRLIALGCPDSKVWIHHIGAEHAGGGGSQRDFGGRLKVLMVGRFVEKKGLVDGLEACALACARGVDLEVTIVGDAFKDHAPGQAIKRELQRLSADPRLAGRVDLAGFLPMDRTRAMLGTHHVLLCPSRHAADGDAEGGSPVILTEAMAAGMVCVGTSHCDIPELIRDGVTGFLAEERSVESIAGALERLGSERSSLQRISLEGMRHVEREFSLQTQLMRLRRIYDAVIDRGAGVDGVLGGSDR